jgi:hypothetical protein
MKPSAPTIGHRINDTVYRRKSGNAGRSNTTGITAITNKEKRAEQDETCCQGAAVK